MAIATEPRSKTSTDATTPSPPMATASLAAAREDLLARLRWSSQRVLVVAGVLIALDALAGWLYLTSYFGYFRVPVEALGLSPAEVLAQGARSMLLPLSVIPIAFVAGAPSRKLGPGALAVGGYVLFLAYVAFAGHLVSPFLIPVEGAAAIVSGAIVFLLRRGFGMTLLLRLILVAAGLLLVTSLPVALGILDASQTASAKQSTFRIITHDPVLPGSAVAGGFFSNSNYVLLRETDSRYWLLRIDNHNTYSIAKTDVLYIRY